MQVRCGDSAVTPFATVSRKLGKWHALRHASGSTIRLRDGGVSRSWRSRFADEAAAGMVVDVRAFSRNAEELAGVRERMARRIEQLAKR